MPLIEVSDQAYEIITGYATRWGQTVSQAVATLVRLYTQPVHAAAPPSGDCEASSNDAGAVQA